MTACDYCPHSPHNGLCFVRIDPENSPNLRCDCTAGYKRPLRITAEGIAIVESGLSLRHAHELKTGCSGDNLCAECRRAIGEE